MTLVSTSAPDGGVSRPPSKAPARDPWVVLAVLCLGLFVLLLDGTIVNVAIPHIMTGLKTDLSGVEWVMNAYVLVFAVSLVTLGRLGDLFGRRRLFLVGIVLFTLASLACGLAPSIGALIGCRVAQGLGGAAMMPQTLSIIATVFPAERRGAAMGIWGAVSGLATAIGPSLGGLIVDGASWRWIFLINLPIGLLAVVLTLRLVPESTHPEAVKSLDLPGVALITASMSCLTFALIEGQGLGWGSAPILGLFAATVVLLGLFYVRERLERQPLVDFSLFRSVNFAAGNLTGLLLSFGMMGAFFTIPIFLQTILGYSALKAGAVMSPMSVAVMVAAPLAGRLSDRVGSRWLIAAGMLLLALGIGWMTGFNPWGEGLSPSTSVMSLMLPFILAGFGIGMAIAPTTAAVMATAPADRVGNASGVLSTVRQLGSLMGIAVLGAVLQNRVVHNVTQGLDAIPGIPSPVKRLIVEAVEDGGSMGMPAGMAQQGSAMAERFATLFQGWFTAAVNSAFLVAAVVCLVGAASAVLIRRSAAPDGPLR